MILASIADELPAQRGGAKAMLLTVLGEFVLPAGGEVWTSSLVRAAAALGIEEKNARQAIARIGDQGLIESQRHGRRVRWLLTDDGRRMLEAGTERIYAFGTANVDWNREWLVAHCQVTESQRSLRTRMRAQLGFLGFGELTASLLVSPHTDRESQLRGVLDQLGLTDSLVMRSSFGSVDDDAAVVRRAWDLDGLAESYENFRHSYRRAEAGTRADAFRSIVDLVHDWRQFPFIDPELPTQLLPGSWVGDAAAIVFRDRHDAWSSVAQQWFGDIETGNDDPA